MRTILLSMLFIYGCGIKITIKPIKVTLPQFEIKLPEIDMSWAADALVALEKAEKIAAASRAVATNCDRLDSATVDQIKACNESTKVGITMYLDLADKKQVIEFLEQSLNKKKLEIENEKRK